MKSDRSRDKDKVKSGFDDFGLKPRPRKAGARNRDDDSGAAAKDSPSEPKDPLIGADLGGFHIVRLIAEGGMGRVYEGVQEKPRRPVAIKVMRPGCISPEAIRRFENEWELLGKLRHPNIAQIFYASTCNLLGTRVPYFVMEYIPDALPLTKYTSSKKLSTGQRLKLFGRVCEAVAHGHRQGIIHRDLKPSNILVEPSGNLKIIDFGVARNVHAEAEHVTQLTNMGQLIGTLQYMSPEQFTADPSAIDQRSDIYALGVILYELLTGKPPYELHQKHILDAAQVVREFMPESPAKFNQNVTAGMVTITGKCLQKDRSRRYSTAAELASAVAGCLQGQAAKPQAPAGVRKKPAALLTSVSPVFDLIQVRALQSRIHIGRLTSGRTLAALLGVAALLVFMAFAVLTVNILSDALVPSSQRSTIALRVRPVTQPGSVIRGQNLPAVDAESFPTNQSPVQPLAAIATTAPTVASDALIDPPLRQQKVDSAAAVSVSPRQGSAATVQASGVNGSEIFLCDLAPILVKIGFESLLPPGVLTSGQALRIADQPTPHGLLAHPPSNGCSKLVYLLPEGAVKFLATAAIDDTATDKITPLTFRVTDEEGRELWRSPKPLDGRSQYTAVEVALDDASSITLEVDCPGPYDYARAVWSEPRFVVPPSTTRGNASSFMPADALRWASHAYYFFPDVLTQQEAERKCQIMGGHLARIKSTEEHRVVMAAFEGLASTDASNTDPRFWIEGNDRYQEGTWVFSDGSPITVKGWRSGEPNSEGEDEDGLQIMAGGWNDISMSRRCGFICEWDGTQSPTGESVEAAVAKALDSWEKQFRKLTVDRLPKADGPLPTAVEATDLNDPRNWFISKGAWRFTVSGRLHGEGDSAIRFRRKLPWPTELAFKMQVLNGMRPRVHLGGTDVYFGNEGYDPTLWLYGQVPGLKGTPFRYAANTTYDVTVRSTGERLTLLVGGKEVGTTTLSKQPDNITLELSGGDGWSPGVTEFWDFQIRKASSP